MKKVISLMLALCLLMGLTACGGNTPAPTQEEKTTTTTTTTAPVEDKLTYYEIVGGVRRVMAKDLPVFGSVTDEQQHTLEDGSITKSFKYADDLISVTVTLKNDDIQSVIALCNTAKMPADENINSIQLSIVFMCVVGSVIYNDGDVFAMGDEIIANDPTTMTDVGMTYMLKDEKWEYVMQLTTLISTLYIAPIKTEETTTTTVTGSTTTSQAIHQQPTVSKQQEATKRPTTTQKKPTPTKNQDPCANGHSWEDASCSSPAICSVCKKTSGSALGHEIDITKCLNCDHTDFSKIAKTYSDISAYDLVTGEVYDVQNVKISSSGVFSFTFNGETYKLNLVQKNHSSYGGMVEFDCYRNGKKEVDAVVEVHTIYYNPRLEWRNLDGCDLYIYAE